MDDSHTSAVAASWQTGRRLISHVDGFIRKESPTGRYMRENTLYKLLKSDKMRFKTIQGRTERRVLKQGGMPDSDQSPPPYSRTSLSFCPSAPCRNRPKLSCFQKEFLKNGRRHHPTLSHRSHFLVSSSFLPRAHAQHPLRNHLPLRR